MHNQLIMLLLIQRILLIISEDWLFLEFNNTSPLVGHFPEKGRQYM